MKIDRNLIYQLAGVSMVVGSFFVAARAIGGVITIIYILAATNFDAADKSISESIRATIMASQVPAAISGVASFLILFYGGRWMLRGPSLIERWIVEGNSNDGQPPNDINRLSEQAVSSDGDKPSN